jgi:hypothetical protein
LVTKGSSGTRTGEAVHERGWRQGGMTDDLRIGQEAAASGNEEYCAAATCEAPACGQTSSSVQAWMYPVRGTGVLAEHEVSGTNRPRRLTAHLAVRNLAAVSVWELRLVGAGGPRPQTCGCWWTETFVICGGKKIFVVEKKFGQSMDCRDGLSKE